MPSFETPQEEFWAGEFGTQYAARNAGADLLASNISLFSRILSRAPGVSSVIEFGANVGMNLRALRSIIPSVSLAAVEVNPSAAEELRRIEGVVVHNESVLEFETDERFDLTLSKGLLIHIDPASIGRAYQALFECSRRYVCVAEYYNPTPVEVTYRGYAARLFKRDFAGEMLARFPELRLMDYGFVYRNDPVHPQDDITWFLMERG